MVKSPPSKKFGTVGAGANVPEPKERAPLGVSTPEEGDRVGDIASEVGDVAEMGEGVGDTPPEVGGVAEVGAGVTIPISSK